MIGVSSVFKFTRFDYLSRGTTLVAERQPLRARLVVCSLFWAPWAQVLGAWVAPCDAKSNLSISFGGQHRI
jgi:hypothetical protein